MNPLHPLVVGLFLAVMLLCIATGIGWGLYFSERSAKEMAVQFANEGRMGEPEPAKIRSQPDAEERAHRAARQTAVNRAAAFIKREKPGVSDEQAREEAENLIGQGISGVGEEP